MNTKEGGQKAAKTLKERYTPEQRSEWARQAGKKSSGSFKDPEVARKAVEKRWENARKRGEIAPKGVDTV